MIVPSEEREHEIYNVVCFKHSSLKETHEVEWKKKKKQYCLDATFLAVDAAIKANLREGTYNMV